jgi:lysophospholipase L1-like esterase
MLFRLLYKPFLFLLSIVFLIFITWQKANCQKNMQQYSFLALGDSYTIGEMVPEKDNFPNQAIQLLRKNGFDFLQPEIVAKTGWTTDELQGAINNHTFQPYYDFVTLLIGVNNQYRGRSVDDYQNEFEFLLKQAIAFAHNNSRRVIVLSIPDWGATPFAKERNKKKIADEIDAYNAANKAITLKYGANYLDVTASSREAAKDSTLVAADRLHPSAKEYEKWAVKLSSIIIAIMQ